MSKREKFEVSVSCPKCENKGSAVLSEAEHPVFSGSQMHRTIESVSKGFRQSGDKIVCDCGEIVGAG